MSDIKRLVIYHANCFDGFCAAWLFKKVYPDAEYYAASYGQEPPDCKGKHVFIVDFSYKRPVMLSILAQAESLVVLDHHESAEKELSGLAEQWMDLDPGGLMPHIKFDMNKSGGRLAYEYLWAVYFSTTRIYMYTKDKAPWLVDYTEDRDLWRYALPDSKAINAWLRSYPLDNNVWNIHEKIDPQTIVLAGQSILRVEQQIIDHHVSQASERSVDGHKVLVVNATVLVSEITGKLAEGRAFGASYRYRQDGKQVWSLRSDPDGLNVSEIAKRLGGGGHKHAAGFEVDSMENGI